MATALDVLGWIATGWLVLIAGCITVTGLLARHSREVVTPPAWGPQWDDALYDPLPPLAAMTPLTDAVERELAIIDACYAQGFTTEETTAILRMSRRYHREYARY